jgi:hypothetical protein
MKDHHYGDSFSLIRISISALKSPQDLRAKEKRQDLLARFLRILRDAAGVSFSCMCLTVR